VFSKESLVETAPFALALAVPLALVGVLALGLVSLVLRDASIADGLGAVIPALRLVRPHAAAPVVVCLAPVVAWGLILAARHARSGEPSA
jgi:hypothetical protein